MSEQNQMLTAETTNRGWMVVFAGTGINVILGTLYAWSVMGKAMVAQWKWSATDASLPFAIATASFAITMVFAGRVQDRVGPKLVAIIGGALLGLAMIISSLSQDPVFIRLAFGILGGMGIGIGYSATTPAAMKWFPPSKKGLISGIVVAGVGFAAVFMAPLTNFLVNSYGIQHAFQILGAGTIVIVALLSLLLQAPPAGYVVPVAASAAKRSAPVAKRDYDWGQMLTTPQFYCMWFMYVLSAAPGLMIISNAGLIVKATKVAFDPMFGPMIIAAFNTGGRLFGGFLSDKIGRRQTMTLVFVLQAANMVAFSHYTTSTLLTTGLALTGLFYGSFFALMPAAAADFYGLKNMGVNYGLIFTGFGVAGVVGSLMGGKIYDLFGSFDKAFMVFAGMLLVSAILALLLRSPKQKESADSKAPEMAGTK
jgi:MFS transporter, OFA family, oxalate/formate antiporter